MRRALILGGSLLLVSVIVLLSYLRGPFAPDESEIPQHLYLANTERVEAISGAALGLLGALAIGGAAVLVNLRVKGEVDRSHGDPVPAPFPGMFGSPTNDPFAPFKARIDREEPSRDALGPPALDCVAEACPECREALGRTEGDDPCAFCHHCGAVLA